MLTQITNQMNYLFESTLTPPRAVLLFLFTAGCTFCFTGMLGLVLLIAFEVTEYLKH